MFRSLRSFFVCKKNVSFIFRTFRSFFEFFGLFWGQKWFHKSPKTQKSNKTFEKWTKRSFLFIFLSFILFKRTFHSLPSLEKNLKECIVLLGFITRQKHKKRTQKNDAFWTQKNAVPNPAFWPINIPQNLEKVTAHDRWKKMIALKWRALFAHFQKLALLYTFYNNRALSCAVTFSKFWGIFIGQNAGLGTAFFCAQNASFFCVLFLCFWRVMKPKRTMHSFTFFSKERREWNVLLKRM